MDNNTNHPTQLAVFGGGCFWCTEAVFKMLRGVTTVTPGYTGGTKENPNYGEVCDDTTGHAEVVRVEFNPEQISYHDLLTVFFATHDPTSLNRQGNDVGTQYRSAIFYADNAQKTEGKQFIEELNASSPEGKPIVTTLEPLGAFYTAEQYHQDYYTRNSGQPYCQFIIVPKLQKVQEKFSELLKEIGVRP